MTGNLTPVSHKSAYLSSDYPGHIKSQMERNAKKTASLPTHRLGKESKILSVEVDRATA